MEQDGKKVGWPVSHIASFGRCQQEKYWWAQEDTEETWTKIYWDKDNYQTNNGS